MTDIVLTPFCAKCPKFPEFKISGDEAMKAGAAQAGAGVFVPGFGTLLTAAALKTPQLWLSQHIATEK